MSEVVIAEEWEGFQVETTLSASENTVGKLRIGRPSSVRELDGIVVRSVENVRMSVVMSDVRDEIAKEFQTILSSQKAELLQQLDALGAAPDQLLLMGQDMHDIIFERTWKRHEKLVESIVNGNFLPFVRGLPVVCGEKCHLDCVIEVLVDVSSGFRKFSYLISQQHGVERTVTKLPTVTLDTNVPFEFWKGGTKSSVVERLMGLATSSPRSLRVTNRICDDVPKRPLADRIVELPELGIDLMGSVIRYGHWEAGVDTLGSARFEQVRESIVDRADRRSGRPDSGPDWRDWDHLHAHYLRRRDAFLTWDTGILGHSEELREGLGIVLMRPEEYLAKHDANAPGMPD